MDEILIHLAEPGWFENIPASFYEDQTEFRAERQKTEALKAAYMYVLNKHTQTHSGYMMLEMWRSCQPKLSEL